MFLHRDWVIGASFNPVIDSDMNTDSAVPLGIRAVISHNHALHTLHTPHARYDTARGHIFPRVNLMSGKRRQLQESASHICQGYDSTGAVSLKTPQP